jgi:peptide chain release factor 2
MDLKSRAEKIKSEVASSIDRLDIENIQKKREELFSNSQQPDFWQDSAKAQKVMKQISEYDQLIETWRSLENDSNTVFELIELGHNDIETDLEVQIDSIDKRLKTALKDLAYNGPYDDHDSVVSIYAGAGGTDAQDWTQMLLRMYTRWAETSGFKVNIIDESTGEEAGIKSVSFTVSGQLSYGKLRGEHGVHRLVRQSPFNADAKRQTSFAKVEVLPKIDEPDEVPIDEKDLKIDVFRAGGHGGQSVNTTDSAVRVTHLPTKIVVSIQNERSQLQNRETALTILRSKLAQLQVEQHAEKISQLKGPNEQAAWGNQIRSYVLHPYKMVKDLRTNYETSNVDTVLDGDLDAFCDAYLNSQLKQ